MTIDIKVPSMGESVSEAVISAILKPTGSFVRADEDVIELETDKVNQVLYAPAEGKLSWKVAVGDRVAIGQILGQVDTTSSSSALEPKELPVVKPVVAGGSARKMAESFVQEIKHVPEKQEVPISKVETEMSSKYTRKSMSNLRKVLSKRLVEAKNTTAMLTTFNEIDMSTILEIRMREKERFQEKYGARLGFMSFFVKGVVSALQAIPQVNAYIDGEDIVTMHTYDIGVAVSTDRGLVVPVIRGCEALGFGGIEKAIATFAEKAKKGGLSVDDLRGGSFTITNGGVFGSLLSTPILNPPQSAILGMHAIVKRPVVVEDEIVIRPMMYVALSYDHRIVDGKEAVLFLVHLKQMLEDPAKLLLESN